MNIDRNDVNLHNPLNKSDRLLKKEEETMMMMRSGKRKRSRLLAVKGVMMKLDLCLLVD